ncbi:hypothetical protein M0804_014194 [Polistes exclamans]|nr:hypothetical protein M0804_014197 [Polistes exclamans]KAI4475613.1 hypothetical protein M0804_014194 [Polistes exclamans]
MGFERASSWAVGRVVLSSSSFEVSVQARRVVVEGGWLGGCGGGSIGDDSGGRLDETGWTKGKEVEEEGVQVARVWPKGVEGRISGWATLGGGGGWRDHGTEVDEEEVEGGRVDSLEAARLPKQ